MGELRDKKIVQSRIWLDPNQAPMPSYDYDYSYPITVYEAVHQTMDDKSATLADELDSIYRLINGKQDIIDPGVPGQLMTWTGVRGQIGAIGIVNTINPDSSLRSTKKVPSERAVGDALDDKVDISSFNSHTSDNSIHLTDVERNRWNSMAPLSTLQAHIGNASMHITDAERGLWNNKANQSDLEDHIYNTNNPHNVTAHQVGTYTRKEIDEIFENLRETFFNYQNISWDSRTNQASLVEYNAANWNPNYVLEFSDALPDVPDQNVTYFALRPATDYSTNETQDCIIYIKRPAMAWSEVGFQNMTPGDMVIKYPDTTMYVWVAGRFLKLFTGSTNQPTVPGTGGTSDKLWKPSVDVDGNLTWALSSDTTTPAPVCIKGQDGKTPIKGVDYVDGKDGEGVPVGGKTGELLIKLTETNYDTTWRSLTDLLADLVIGGSTLPAGLIEWNSIKGKPEWYNELGDNEDGFITQRAATRQFEVIGNNISDILLKLQDTDDTKQDLFDHVNDFNNPHRVTAAQIGAVPIDTYSDHIQNFDNPHNVTASQIGLGNVNNTSDLDKPISNATQIALDALLTKINSVSSDLGVYNAIVNVTWDNTSADMIFTYKDNSELKVHVPIPEIFNSIYYDDVEQELVIVLPDGTENRVDISKMIQHYFGSLSDNIQVQIEDGNVIKATIVPGTVGELEIAPSVHLRSSPTTTTQPVTDNSTRIATTEFVHKQTIDNLISYETERPLSANMGRILNQKKADIEDVIQLINDMEGVNVVDNLDSTNPLAALSANMGRYLDLTKAPRVHTSPSGSTFGRATVSLFGHTRASDVDPLMDGTVFRGTDDGLYARGDHRHPTDETRAPMHWPDVGHNQYQFTGEPRSTLAPDDSNDNWIATTEWVRRNAVGTHQGESYTSGLNPNKEASLRSTFCNPVVFIRQIGSAVSITFSNEDRSGSTPTTLDVEGTGAAPILFAGAPLTNGMIGKNHTHLFIFDGDNWRLINPVPGTGIGGPDGINIGPGVTKPDDDTPTVIINTQSGHNGFTTQADGTIDENGQVERVWFTINFTPKSTDVEVTLSDFEDCFSARMGDGVDILLRDAKVVSLTRSNCVVQFTMKEFYPANSPCQLIYRSNKAWINIKEK